MIAKPMLAVAVKDIDTLTYPIAVTPKLDGIRCLIVNGQAVSRKFKPIPNHYVRTRLQCLPDGLDGEIMCTGKTFNEIQSLIMSEEGEPEFYYAVFDYVKDDLKKPYVQRMQDLEDFLYDTITVSEAFVSPIYPVIVKNAAHLTRLEKDYLSQNYEGAIIRSLNSPYKCGRSTLKEGYLLKLKRFSDSEAEIIGFEEQLQNNNEALTDELGHTKRSSHKENLVPNGMLGALLLRDIETGVEFSLGIGFDYIQRLQIWVMREDYLGKLVTYTYQSSGMKDKPRFPVFKGFRHPSDT